MIFIGFCLLVFCFKFSRFIYLLIFVEFLVLRVYFYLIFFCNFIVFIFLCIRVLGRTTSLVILVGLVNSRGKDICLFYRFKLNLLNY